MATGERSVTNFRAQALLALATRHPLTRQRVQAVLERHPDSATMLALLEDAPLLEEVLWRELESTENAVARSEAPPVYGARAAWDYYQRKRRTARLLKWASASVVLGAPWVELMKHDAPGTKRKCVAIGVAMLAACVSATKDAGDWLAKLGTTLAIEVIQRSRLPAGEAISARTAHRWRMAYSEIAGQRADAEIASVLGRRLLAGMFAKLPESSRQLATATAASNLFEVLQRETPLDPAEADESEIARSLVIGALRDDDEADTRREHPGKGMSS